MQGALSHITAAPPKLINGENFSIAHFDPNGVDELVFQMPDSSLTILAVYIGGIRGREGVQYEKNDEARTVTYLGAAADLADVGIDVDYFRTTGEDFADDFSEDFD
jgi:hypothetical protein